MIEKESTIKEDLLTGIYLFECESILYWLDGVWFEYKKDYFGKVVLAGKIIICISLRGQKAFHSGYEPRDKDTLGNEVLESIVE